MFNVARDRASEATLRLDRDDLDTPSTITFRMDSLAGRDDTEPSMTLRIDDLVDQNGQAIHDRLAAGPTGDTAIDTSIAPWVTDEPPSPPLHPLNHSASSTRGFSSISSFWPLRQNSSVSLVRSTRGSDSTTYLAVPDGTRRSTDDADSIRQQQASSSSGPGELRKSKSSIFSRIRRRGSKSHLHQSSTDDPAPPPPLPTKSEVFNTPVDPPHPLAHLAMPPPIPPRAKERERERERDRDRDREGRRKKKKKDSAQGASTKDEEPLYPLDTNLESMEGIIDLTRSANDLSINPSSPGSATVVFESPQADGIETCPPTFSNPFLPPPPSDTKKVVAPGHPRISPTTVLPEAPENLPRDGQEGVWKPPESWAVVDQNGLQNGKPEMTAPEDDDSSDEDTRTVKSTEPQRQMKHKMMRARMYPPSLNTVESIRPSKRGKGGAIPVDNELAVRVYRPNGLFHIAALGVSLTVYDLLPALHRRTLTGDKNASRLFLKDRAKERILDMREVPLDIIYRRQNEAGYTWNDGLILLAGEHLSFLLRFIYRDPDLGLGRRSFTSDPHNLPFEDAEVRLENFDYVDLTGRSLRAIPVILHQHADQIISLKLSRNPMIDIPLDFVEACTQLRDLRMSNMSMRKVPANLTAAKWLRRLDLSFNNIKVKDLEGGRLHKIPELSSLYLQNNFLKDLPASFADHRVLTTLNVSNNKLKHFPKALTMLTNLRDLDISFNYLEELPENINNLVALERFLFVGNAVVKIPHNFYYLSNLNYVDCRRNEIADLTIICNLPQLNYLYADHNAVHLLDLSMGPNLTAVDVSYNEITQITLYPGPIGQPPHSLTLLDLSYASLTTFDDAVLSNLTSLVQLKLQHNNLSYIPDSLGNLADLETLLCNDNRLIQLPETIGKLSKLQRLDLYNNNLREVPSTIWNCGELTSLNLSTNFLTTFPPPTIIPVYPHSVASINGHIPEIPTDYNRDHVILGHLYPPLSFRLEALSVSENKLKDPDALRSISFIRSLLSLNLSYNEISDIPSGFFRELIQLRELYFCGNEITTLPAEELARLKDLHTLFLGGNKLTALPAELSRLEQLRVIDVSNNNLRYNINNYEFDWNWNFNRYLRYLNLSGNKRLQIKPDSRHTGTSRSSRELNYGTGSLSGFASLRHLRNLGLMDVTVTASDAYVDLPDENEDRRIRSTASVVGGFGYGMSDCLGTEGALTMLDLVHEFPGHPNKALFAMFGNTRPPKSLPPGISPNRHAKYLHDHFLEFFQNQLDNPEMQESKYLVVDVIRRSFLGLHQAIHNQLFTSAARKMSAGSALGAPTLSVDPVTARGGCSGIVVYIEEKRLFAANVGTALAVISCKGKPSPVSRKHDPWDPEELRRIRRSEGWISPGGMVNDQVDVSRSFGYYHMLPVVNAAPDMFEWDISDTDEFLIIGNQGLWDYVSFPTAVDIASTTNDPMLVSQKLRDFAISYGSKGSIMVMAIRLRDAHDKSLVRSSNILDPSLAVVPPPVHTSKHSGHMVVDKSVRRRDPEVAPPTGHIALVFTDIRNSTHLWEVNPGMPAAIQLHNDVMRRRLRDCGGYEFKTEGDAFLCSFPTVLSAVWFCLSVQVQLLQEHWPLELLDCEDGQAIVDLSGNLIARGVSVRMGIHCGAPLCAQDPVTHRMDYLGPVINRAARVSGIAQGGQIMCSADVIREIRASVMETAPQTEYSKFQPQKAIDGIKQLGVVIRDVGEKKLKGLEVPEFVSAIYPSGLETRHDLGADDLSPASVYLSVAHVREMGLLCLRLETLASGRIFKPVYGNRDSHLPINVEEEDDTEQRAREPWRALEGDPDNMMPPMTNKSTDHDLLVILDSLTCRIQSALQGIIKRLHVSRIDAPSILSLLEDEGVDPRTLALLQELLGNV